VPVTVNGDLLNEANETFYVDFSSATNTSIVDSRGIGTIIDNDPLAPLTINDVSTTEGDRGSKTVTFTVTLLVPTGTFRDC
jgi:hypothetical protein